jgi:hypothetical protein
VILFERVAAQMNKVEVRNGGRTTFCFRLIMVSQKHIRGFIELPTA